MRSVERLSSKNRRLGGLRPGATAQRNRASHPRPKLRYDYERTTVPQSKDEAAHTRKCVVAARRFLIHRHRCCSNLVACRKADRDRSLTGVLAVRSFNATGRPPLQPVPPCGQVHAAEEREFLRESPAVEIQASEPRHLDKSSVPKIVDIARIASRCRPRRQRFRGPGVWALSIPGPTVDAGTFLADQATPVTSPARDLSR